MPTHLQHNRELFNFDENSWLTSTDGKHKLTFELTNNQIELRAGSHLSFLTGDPPGERLRILANGNIGVGKITASHKLDVAGTVNAVQFFQNGAPISSSQWGPALNGISYDDGNVGIGTQVPNRLLTIQGGGGAYLNVKANGGTHEVLLGADNAGGIVSTMTNHDLQLRAGGNFTRLVVKANGNVGIATLDPGFRLDVADRIRVRQGGSLSAGIWFFQNTSNSDRAFVGMANDDQVGSGATPELGGGW